MHWSAFASALVNLVEELEAGSLLTCVSMLVSFVDFLRVVSCVDQLSQLPQLDWLEEIIRLTCRVVSLCCV